MFTSNIYNKTKSTRFENLDVLIYFCCKWQSVSQKVHHAGMGMLIGREHNKRDTK